MTFIAIAALAADVTCAGPSEGTLPSLSARFITATTMAAAGFVTIAAFAAFLDAIAAFLAAITEAQSHCCQKLSPTPRS
jgi:hypothetical protein